ncbi:MAG: carboxylating nicotinate-nucleotide diphosphorylase [Candidatus Sumerlaeota bacterium]|nr:carboxylating nicotinate-nucleotide diphosphorylase [Candidatus Sumerlaeota bacterium]
MKPTLPRLTHISDTATLDLYLRLALEEDGAFADATCQAIVPETARMRAVMIAKEGGVFCGGIVAERVFRLIDPQLRVRRLAREGAAVEPKQRLMTIHGRVRSILSAERVALNFVQRLSGIATLTRKFVEAIANPRVSLLDTRKTTPLWRALERYAVRSGGGRNHRFALDDMIMIKENHADAIGGVGRAVERARRARPDLRIAAEARTEAEAREAAEAGADLIMLDNMSASEIRRALRAIAGRAPTEATGGVTLRTARSLARTGVDRLSVGAITHSAPALDVSLDLAPQEKPGTGTLFRRRVGREA